MIVQDIVFPEKGICEYEEMYFRGGKISENNQVLISKGDTLSMGTYFNSFSIGKWLKYTSLDNLSLELCFSSDSDVKIRCIHSTGVINDQIAVNAMTEDQVINNVTASFEELPIILRTDISGSSKIYTIRFEKLPTDGIIYVEIEAMKESGLLSGCYKTETDQLNPVRMALGICTFKREEEVRFNVNKIITEVFNNPDHELNGHLEVFVSDNGQTLPLDEFKSDKVHLFYNRNAGGSGGFTRTMIEAIYKYQGPAFTRMILMDDDVVFSVDVLKRTYRLLQLLKEEYSNAIIGGAMLLKEERNLQHENGSKIIDDFQYRPLKRRWDLKNINLLAANELTSGETYNGWWYCCYSVESIKKNNLPNPVFLHFDDVEYCHRMNRYGYILMNGINVWHPSFNGKQKLKTYYFDLRNCLIMLVGSETPIEKRYLGHKLRYMGLRWFMRYQYDEIMLMEKAIRDFLKGPEYLLSVEPLSVMKELDFVNEREYFTPKELQLSLDSMESHLKSNTNKDRIIQMVQLFLPVKNEVKIVDGRGIWMPGRSKRVYVYRAGRGDGYLNERDTRRGLNALKELYNMVNKMDKNYETLVKCWSTEKSKYTSHAAWRKYLKI